MSLVKVPLDTLVKKPTNDEVKISTDTENVYKQYQQSHDYTDEDDDDPPENDEELGITDEEYIEDAIPESELYSDGNSLEERIVTSDNFMNENKKDEVAKAKDESSNVQPNVEDNAHHEGDNKHYVGERESNNEEGDENLSMGRFTFQPKKDATLLKMNKDSDINKVAWDELKLKGVLNANNVFDEDEDENILTRGADARGQYLRDYYNVAKIDKRMHGEYDDDDDDEEFE